MESMKDWLDPIFRWLHVVAGITWIGHLYFFNFVNAQLAKTYDADSKKKVVPELMPRALYWFRWGAMYTLISGLLLASFQFWHPFKSMMVDPNVHAASAGASLGAGVATVLLGFFIYDLVWKNIKDEKVGMVVSFVLLAGVLAAWNYGVHMAPRALMIHTGALFGTIMAMNVWMRIWPAQKKIIGGIAGTSPAPDASVAPMAGLRSKHNTYMSVPLVFLMLNAHNAKFATLIDDKGELEWVVILGFVAVGWIVTKMLYTKSASAAPKSYQ